MRICNEKVMNNVSKIHKKKILVRGNTSNTAANDSICKNRQDELFGSLLNPSNQSKFNPKTLSSQGTLRYKKNDLLKHCFTGRFQNEDFSNKEITANISTPMTQQENTGVLKQVKEMVFSDLLKLAKNVYTSQDNASSVQQKTTSEVRLS